jgi:hypothetical protein
VERLDEEAIVSSVLGSLGSNTTLSTEIRQRVFILRGENYPRLEEGTML